MNNLERCILYIVTHNFEEAIKLLQYMRNEQIFAAEEAAERGSPVSYQRLTAAIDAAKRLAKV